MQAATEEVARRDKVMARLIQQVGPCTIRPGDLDHFAALARSILFQQLAGKAAAAIHARFRAGFSDGFTPAAVLAAPEEQFRAAGLSRAKMLSIVDLARRVDDGSVPLKDIDQLSDHDVIERLTTVRGIGRWTAEMFLIFQLRRLDVWPVDDYGVRKGYALAYQLKELPSPKELLALGERFRPYRTIAAWYCWRAVDTVLMGDADAWKKD